MSKKILSIDGGGIGGLIPALVLARLEELCQKACCQLFDLMAGTSTGGIIALGLSTPDSTGRPAYTARQLAEQLVAEHDERLRRLAEVLLQ